MFHALRFVKHALGVITLKIARDIYSLRAARSAIAALGAGYGALAAQSFRDLHDGGKFPLVQRAEIMSYGAGTLFACYRIGSRRF